MAPSTCPALLPAPQLVEFLSAVGEPTAQGEASAAAVASLFRAADADGGGRVTFGQVCYAIRHHLFRVEHGRFFCAVTLAEAEGLRALLHCSRARGTPLLPSHPAASLALRHGAVSFEASLGFRAASEHQQTTARQCFRLYDSEVAISPNENRMRLRPHARPRASARARASPCAQPHPRTRGHALAPWAHARPRVLPWAPC